MDQGRFLITTADERTWKTDVPVLFLGEWCKLFDRRHVWSRMDAITADYHWDDRGKFNKDYVYLDKVYETCLVSLADKLNEIHQVRHSLRYWRIVVGPWLNWFISIVFDRWAMLEKVFSEYVITGFKTIQVEQSAFVAQDIRAFTQLMLSDAWNAHLYAEIIHYFNLISLEEVEIHRESVSLVCSAEQKKAPKAWFKAKVQSTLQYFSTSEDAFFMGNHLTYVESWKLQKALGQMPCFWQNRLCVNDFGTFSQRKWQLAQNEDVFVGLLSNLIPKHLPVLYCEGYDLVKEKLKCLGWPNSPQFIFTTSVYSDDFFKIWIAEKVKNESKLIVCQHGGGYGTSKVISIEDHEVAIADKYLTWGWNDPKQPHVLPALKFNTKARMFKLKGDKLFLVSNTYPRMSYKLTSEAVASQGLKYLNDQFRFVEMLPVALQEKLIVRLGVTANHYKWHHEARWLDRLPKVQIDKGAQPIFKAVRCAKLVVSTYNATNFIEALADNVPVILFCDPNLWELREDAISYFDCLKQVGIVHDTPESAALKTEEIFNNVELWWKQPKLQEARLYFCERHAKSFSRNKIQHLKKILIENGM